MLRTNQIIKKLKKFQFNLIKFIILLSFLFYIGYILTDLFIKHIINQYSQTIDIFTLNAGDVILVIINTSLKITLVLLFPFFYRYIKDSLYEKEKNYFKAFKYMYILGLFGAYIGYLLCIYYLIPSLFKFNLEYGVESSITITSIISLITINMFVFFLIAQVPFLIKGLIKTKIIKKKDLRKQWKTALFISLALGVILSPSEPLSMFIFAIPIFITYSVSII